MTIRSNVEPVPGVGVAVIKGEVDLATVDDFTASIERAAVDSAGVVIDLSGVTYLDSSGIRALFELATRTPRMKLAAVLPADSPVRRVVGLVNLGAALPICESSDDALSALRPSA